MLWSGISGAEDNLGRYYTQDELPSRSSSPFGSKGPEGACPVMGFAPGLLIRDI